MNAASVPSLDPGTLLFAISILGFLMSGIAVSSAGAMPSHKPALLEWGKAMAAGGGGFLLYFLRGYAPWFLTFLVANILVMMTAAFGHFAFAKLMETGSQRVPVTVISVFGLSGVLASYALDVPRLVAVFTISSGVSIVLGLTAVLLVRSALIHRTPPTIIAAGITGLMSAGFAMRAAISVLGDASTVSPASSSATQVSALLTGALFIVASSVGFFALVHERQRQVTLDSVRRDGLTGVCTRSAFFELASALESEAGTQPYAIVMVDIDRFKQVNDTFGHAGGDFVLAHAGRLIARAVRLSDVVGRYGGEEFCIMLRDCDPKQAADLAQRLVQDAARQIVRLRDGRTAAYTLSVGYAVNDRAHQEDGMCEALHAVIERADQALFLAKKRGRNQAIAAFAPGLAASPG